MTPPLRDEIQALAKTFPVPHEEKLQRRMARLERMYQFYETKAPEAPEKQGMMFKAFVSALAYAMTTIKMYRKLTVRLAEMAEGKEEEEEE